MADMYAVKMEDMPKIYRAFVLDEDGIDLSAVPDAVINEQAALCRQLGSNLSNETVRGIIEQVGVAFRLPSRKLAGDAALNLFIVYHGTSQAMERLGSKTVSEKVMLEGQAMMLEVMRKIMMAQIGDDDLDSNTVPPRPDSPDGT